MPRKLGAACPVCGDPRGFPLWIDGEPPEGCPEDREWMEGRPHSIRSVAECSYQRRKAEQQAKWRKLCPEAFDDAGNIKPGGLVAVLTKLDAIGDTEDLIT